MKATLSYDLPNEQAEFDAATWGFDAIKAIHDVLIYIDTRLELSGDEEEKKSLEGVEDIIKGVLPHVYQKFVKGTSNVIF